jgi:ribose transport system substrate-binding protein
MKRTLVFVLTLCLLITACTPAAAPAAAPAAPSEAATVAPAAPAEAATVAPAAPATAAPAAAAAPAVKKDKYIIGVSYEGPTNDWAASMMYHLQYSFDIKYKDKVEKVYYVSADGDATKQVSQIEDLLTKGVDALMIQPLSESALVNVVEKASGMGIPVFIFGASVLTDKYVTYVDRENYESGKVITEWICKAMGGKGKVVTIMGEPGSGFSENVLRGVSDALKECPGVTNVGTEYGEYSAAVTKQKMETFLSSNKDINGVIVDGGMMGMGILEAYADAGLPYPYMTVDDWNGFQKKAKEIGYTNYISIPGGSGTSAIAADLLFDYLSGKQVPKESLVPTKIMTGAEVQALIPEGMPDSYWALSYIPVEFAKQYFK